MSRWFFAVSVAIMSVAGIFIVFSDLKQTEKFSPEEPTANVKKDVRQTKTELPFETPQIPEEEEQKFYCKDQTALKIWKVLKKSDYMQGFVDDRGETGNCRDYLQITHRIDLNNDGQVEFYVESGYKTGPVSFQTAWIFQKKNGTYKKILDQERDDNFKILKHKTNGFHDLYFVSRRDTGSAFLSTYKFNGKEYESVKCLVGVYFNSGEQMKIFNCENEKAIEEFQRNR